jgi:microsomal epoxide hydrolase
MGKVEPFTIRVGDDVLADLKERLSRARFAPDFANAEWTYGTEAGYLKELIAYWRDDYDWRKHEAEINPFANVRPEIDGAPIHVIHEPA